MSVINIPPLKQNTRLSVAPMMDWTDRNCRMFHRAISKGALLYTEMVTAPALVRGGALRLLDFDAREHPVALQLGGSDPHELAEATKHAVARGYAEVNLNCGCPSDRVQSGTFGAILMTSAPVVADCVARMQDAAGDVPVTVKCRLGVDDQNVAETLPEFIEHLARIDVPQVTIHARKAWLQGLSPKENRDIPPLDYDLPLAMKTAHPNMLISLNGGLDSLEAGLAQLARGFDGVMFGRAAYHKPYDILAQADGQVFGMDRTAPTREAVVMAMQDYIEAHMARGGKLAQVTRHMLGLFAGQPGARIWRRHLSEQGHLPSSGWHTVMEALEAASGTVAGFE